MEFTPEHRGPVVIKAANSNTISDTFRDRLVIQYEYLNGTEPTIEFRIGGLTLDTPIMVGPINGMDKANEAGTLGFAKAISDTGSIFWSNFHNKEEWTSVLDAGIKGIRTIKPLADNDRLLEEIAFDTAHGAVGYAMDIDHGFNVYGKFDGQREKFSSKTTAELKMLNDASPLPFFLKGILSVKDALAAKEAGAAGIVVSGHNNRFPCQIPALMVLPKIREAVGDDLMILVDGGLNNGYDAFKALALGADGVLSARAMLAAYAKGGPDGVSQKIAEMTAELLGAMANTGSPDLQHINRSCITLLP